MPEKSSTPEETPTVSLKVNAPEQSLLAEWLAIEPPEGSSADNLYYTVELHKDGAFLDVVSVAGELQVRFDGIDFRGEHLFQATVQAILPKERMNWGPLQLGDVTVKDGKDISVPRVTGVFANTLDDANSGLTLSVRWDEREGGPPLTWSVRLVGRNSKLDAKPAKNITVNLATFSKEQSGIEAGDKYTVYVTAASAEATGVPSEGFEFIAGEDPDSEEDAYDAHFNANSGTAGDPINMATGSFSYQHTDLQIAGTPPFVFQTFYFSTDAVKSRYPAGKDDPDPDTVQVLGNGWSHTYMTFLKATKNDVSVYWGAGGKSRYKAMTPSLDGTRYSLKGVYDGSKLFCERSTGRYILTTHAQQQYVFDADGRLLQIVSIEGNVIRLDYVAGRLQKVVKVTSTVEKQNDSFELAYDGGRLTSVTDNFGRKIRYAVRNKNLESYTDAASGTRQFTYYDRSLMKTAKDQNGDVFVYNEYQDGKVVFQQDANAYALRDTVRYGLRVEYRKAGKKMTAAVTDNMEHKITYVSDSRGNLLSQETILADGTAYRSFAYDSFNNLIRETEYEGDRTTPNDGKVTQHRYDGNLNRLESNFVTPDGKSVTIGKWRYNRFNQKVEATDDLENRTVYVFNAGHELERIELPLEQTQTYRYKSGMVRGLVETFTDRLGNSFRFTYERDLLVSATDPYGQTTQFSNYQYGLPREQKILDRKGTLLKMTLNAYNALGDKISESVLYGTQPLTKAFKTELTLDALGQVTAVKNPGGYTTRHAYNPNMKLVKTTFPAVNGVTSELLLEYDRNDNVVQTNSGEGVTETFAYDALNRCIRSTDGNGNSYEFKYLMESVAGKPFTTTQRTVFPPLGDGETWSEAVVSDLFGRPVERVGRDRQVTRNVYTATRGRLKVVTLEPQAVSGDPKTQYSSEELFDELGRLIESIDREGRKTVTAYALRKEGPNDTFVSVVTETNPLNIATILQLDSIEQTLFVKKAEEEARYTYDALGRLTASDQRVRNAERIQITHAYSFDDGLGLLKAETLTGTSILSTSYFDGMNQLVKQKNGLGTITERRYDEKGELSELSIGSGQRINYTYDKAGRNSRIQFSDQTFVTNRYDKAGNCLETTQVNAKGIETSKQTRSFDAWNRQKRLTDLNGAQAGYQYNAADQLTQLTYPALPGERDTVAVDYTYDNLQRMVKVTDWKKRVTEYAYSPDGLLVKTSFSNRVVSDCSFDKAQRFTSLKTSREGMIILDNRWTVLDGNGNPLKSTSLQPLAPAAEKGSTQFSYNLGNQLTKAGSATITYDVNGNPVSLPEAGSLRFNDLNLMTQYGGDEYAYDAAGLRASSRINGKRRNYWISPNAYQAPNVSILNPAESGIPGRETGMTANESGPTAPQLDPLDQLLQMTDESQKLEKRFVHGLGLIAEENAAGEYLVYHFDERGSTVAMSDAQGDIVNRFAYSVHGGLTNQYGERSTPFLYNGRQGVFTDANNLCSMRSRFYQPGNMRFLQQDFLLGDPFSSQSLNRYAYVAGNPIRYVDPLGLDRQSGQGGGGSGWLKWLFVAAGVVIVGYAVYRYKRSSSLRRFLLRRIARTELRMGTATIQGNLAEYTHFAGVRANYILRAEQAASRKSMWLTIAMTAGTGVAGLILADRRD